MLAGPTTPVDPKPEGSLCQAACQAARLARDARFDGLFYTAVLSTGIYCRPICPARAPKENNVRYFSSAAACAQAGYRPCLRCAPDSAPGTRPGSPLVAQAIALFAAGASLIEIATQLGISDRYLRQCFHAELGVAPKQYQLYQRCLLAKQLLHQTDWPITRIAFASGFQSVRRFNDGFKAQLQLTPSQVRRRRASSDASAVALTLTLAYRPPYNWPWVAAFLQARAIKSLEQATNEAYGRSFLLGSARGRFIARHRAAESAFSVTLWLDDWHQLPAAVAGVRRILDLDSNALAVDAAVQAAMPAAAINAGLRLPQFPSAFEAGIRAILGQQVSVSAARNLVAQVVDELGEQQMTDEGPQRWFPTPAALLKSDLLFLKMPTQRRQTLHRLAQFCIDHPGASAAQWLPLKGIGPWTVDYARMRGEAATDVWLSGDLGVKHGLVKLGAVNEQACRPWRSYLTLQLWSQLG